MSANWNNASDKILVNGRYHGSVGEHKHSPQNAARSVLKLCCEFDGLDIDNEETKAKIEISIKRMTK
jgi:hypothetical protein